MLGVFFVAFLKGIIWKKPHQNRTRNKKVSKIRAWPFLDPLYLNNSNRWVMTLMAYYVEFFMRNTMKKKPIKIGQKIKNLHLKIEKSPFGPSLKNGRG